MLAAAPKSVIEELQRVLNASARIICGTRKYDRVLSESCCTLNCTGLTSQWESSSNSVWLWLSIVVCSASALQYLLKTSLVTVMISYFRGLTLAVSIYLNSTCLIVLVLIIFFDRGDTTKHLSPKQANSMNVIYTALHVMQTRYSEENSVCPSVCPSVRHTRDPWQNGRKICPDFYTIRKNIYPSFLRRRIVGGGDPFYLKFWVNRPPLERNRRFSNNNRS